MKGAVVLPPLSLSLSPLSLHSLTCQPASPPPPACSTAGAGSGTVDQLSQQMLRKYITYAKQTCHPKLQTGDYDKIARVGGWGVGVGE